MALGSPSNWRLLVEYLTRAGHDMPEHGGPSTTLLTISDPNGVQLVFNDMRQSLSALGVQVEDTSTNARIVACGR
jgi:hypothetical protein